MPADQRQKQFGGVEDARGVFRGERIAAVPVEVDANRAAVACLGKADSILKAGGCIAMRAIICVIDLGGGGADAPASIRSSSVEGERDLVCEIVPPIVPAILAGGVVRDRTAGGGFREGKAAVESARPGEGGERYRRRQTGN